MWPPCSQAEPLLIDQAGGVVFQSRDVGRLNFDLALAARRHAEDAALHDLSEQAVHAKPSIPGPMQSDCWTSR